jgi:hypothetical protein
MEELIRKRNSELRELAASKYAPGPGMGSGPYEQMRVGVSINFYEALFQQLVDSWIDVLIRQSGKISASDVSHVVQELETRASAAPTHIRRALASRGATAHLLPPGAMKALEDGARQRMNELVAKHRRELQTRLYNQDHPHPSEVQPMPNINIPKIDSGNVNSIVTGGDGNKVAAGASKKGWWETWWGASLMGLAVAVVSGLIVWWVSWRVQTRYEHPTVSSHVPDPLPPLIKTFHQFYRQDRVGADGVVCTGEKIPATITVQVSLAGSWSEVPPEAPQPVGPLGYEGKWQTYIILRAFDDLHESLAREPYLHSNVLSAKQDYEVCVQLPAGFVINEKQNDLLNFTVVDSRLASQIPK